jgi:hypothetical protein
MLARTIRNFQVDGNKSDFNMSDLVLIASIHEARQWLPVPAEESTLAARLGLPMKREPVPF